jgi:hypothetical protein
MKVQVVPETYGGSRYIALLILNLGTRLTPQEGIPVPRLSPKGDLDSFGEDKIFPLPGLKPGPPVSMKSYVRGLLEKYPTFGREKETGLLGALDT